jgi:hypothetical protein
MMKPVVDAYRVASGTEHEEGKVANAHYEMSLTKGIEIFAEAIPGALIQVRDVMTSERRLYTYTLHVMLLLLRHASHLLSSSSIV